MKGYIYKYTFPDGKVYIGQTRRDPMIRHREHLDPTTGPNNSRFWSAYQRYKTCNFEVVRTIERDDKDELIQELNRIETAYIINMRAADPQYGYNVSWKSTQNSGYERILYSALVQIKEHILKDIMAPYDLIMEKITETFEPLTHKEHKIIKKDFIEENYFGLPKTVCLRKLSASRLNDATLFGIGQCYSWIKFKKEEEAEAIAYDIVTENRKEILEKYLDHRAIVKLDKDGNIIKKYYSLNEVAQEYNVPRAANVWNVLKGKQKTAYGYHWAYLKDIKDDNT